jgi:hypothetical protein
MNYDNMISNEHRKCSEDRVVLVHDLETMVAFTVFVRDRVVVVHDLETMVAFTVFVRDRVVVVHDLETP